MNLDKGFTRYIIQLAMTMGILRNQLAYILATVYHETGGTMLPIKETQKPKETFIEDKTVINRLNNAYNRGQLKNVKTRYWLLGWFGRGFVQLTHEYNYKKASDRLGVDFLKKPALVMEVEYAAKILIMGMMEGWFGKKLTEFVTLKTSNFVGARASVNGKDRADLIASYAVEYDKDLLAIGYGVTEKVMVDVNEVIPDSTAPEPVGKSKRFYLWITQGGLTGLMPFVDWKIQALLVLIGVAIVTYSIYSMPAIKLKFQKWIYSMADAVDNYFTN